MAPKKSRSDAELVRLLAQQYRRLDDALEAYYAGKPEQALNVAVVIRVLVHETPSSSSLLGQLREGYFRLDIYDRNHSRKPGVVFSLPLRIKLEAGAGGSATSFVPPEFTPDLYRLVSLSSWWDGDFVPLPGGRAWFTRKSIILGVANKDGGAHVDGSVSDEHAELSRPWFAAPPNPTNASPFDLNTAFGITAQSGVELRDFLQRHFDAAAL